MQTTWSVVVNRAAYRVLEFSDDAFPASLELYYLKNIVRILSLDSAIFRESAVPKHFFWLLILMAQWNHKSFARNGCCCLFIAPLFSWAKIKLHWVTTWFLRVCFSNHVMTVPSNFCKLDWLTNFWSHLINIQRFLRGRCRLMGDEDVKINVYYSKPFFRTCVSRGVLFWHALHFEGNHRRGLEIIQKLGISLPNAK